MIIIFIRPDTSDLIVIIILLWSIYVYAALDEKEQEISFCLPVKVNKLLFIVTCFGLTVTALGHTEVY